MGRQEADVEPGPAIRPLQRLGAGANPAGRLFHQALHVNQVDNAGNFNDLGPRAGRRLRCVRQRQDGDQGFHRDGISARSARHSRITSNPAFSLVTQTDRTWNDSLTRTSRLTCPTAISATHRRTANAGRSPTGVRDRRADHVRLADDAREGWGKRRYIWDASASVQHELRPNVSVDVGYFRTWSGNFTVTDNTLVTPADYDHVLHHAADGSAAAGWGREPALRSGGHQAGEVRPRQQRREAGSKSSATRSASTTAWMPS